MIIVTFFISNLDSLNTDSYISVHSLPSSPDSDSQMCDRQEFYVRFKGPEESQQFFRSLMSM